jgi:dCTP deaminase
MPFWSSRKLRLRLAAEGLVDPYNDSRVVHSAYELGVGGEAFITSGYGETTILPPGRKIVLPPGQFGLLVTQERIRIPEAAIAFISIRAKIKFQGLVNVSGFHVDPGYYGYLKFAVYNAGSHTIVLDQGQPVFMIWFADLDEADDNPYPPRSPSLLAISAEDVAKIRGEVASPAELKQQLDALKRELDKRFQASKQSSLFNRSWVMFFLGILVAVAANYLTSLLGARK